MFPHPVAPLILFSFSFPPFPLFFILAELSLFPWSGVPPQGTLSNSTGSRTGSKSFSTELRLLVRGFYDIHFTLRFFTTYVTFLFMFSSTSYVHSKLTFLRLPPCYETIGSKGCDHVVDGVAVGVCDLVVESSRVTLKTPLSLKMDREKHLGIRVEECVHQMFRSCTWYCLPYSYFSRS